MFASYRDGMRKFQGPVQQVVFTHARGEEVNNRTLYLGVELETEARAGFDPVEILNPVENSNLWGWTADGSLTNGPELKTQPMTWKYFRREFDWTPFETWEKVSAPFDTAGHYNPGIHVHLSKAAFKDEEHLFRFIKFHYENRKLCTAVGGRDTTMGSFAPDKHGVNGGIGDEYYRALASGHNVNGNRYQCVNLHRRNTVELRYFRGGATRNRFKAVVEWAHAVFTYTRVPRRAGLTAEGIMAYMARRPEYANALKLAQGDEAYQAEKATKKQARLKSWERAAGAAGAYA